MPTRRFRISTARRRTAAVGLILAVVGLTGCGADTQARDESASRKPTSHEISRQFARPATVAVPAVDLSAKLQPLHLDAHGTLVPPDYGMAGWYRAGPEPGESGPAVIAGHLDSRVGLDVFYPLEQVKVGNRIRVNLIDGSKLIFRIFDIEQYPVDDFPTAKVYGGTKRPELRMITCAGDYDYAAGHYKDNLVVFAHLMS